jgi:peptidyl-dipeptidase Dcp (EC 3.4.15.5). Metallo peptidase. MEROPS family M03A
LKGLSPQDPQQMKKTGLTLALAAALGLGMTACNRTESPAPGASAEQPAAPSTQDNPFFVQSDLPLQYPHFDRIRDEHFAPAFEAGMAEQLKEIEAIANNPEAPTFDNTIVALENSGQVLDRATTVFFNLVGTDTNDARKKLQADFSPRFAAHQDAIVLDPALFGRIQALYDRRDSLGLDAEGLRLVERYHDDFVRAGARLSDADKAKLKDMNAQLATLGTQFNQNVLNEVNASAVAFDSAEALAGSSEAQVAAAAEEAKKRGLEGKYVSPCSTPPASRH